MKYITITGNKLIEGEFDSSEYNLGSTLDDLKAGYLIPASPSQIKFVTDYPFASPEEIFNEYIDPDRIKKELTSVIDIETEKKIRENYLWKGNKVWLSKENQINYKSYHDRFIKDGLSYKCKLTNSAGESVYLTIENSVDNEEFYKGIVGHIETCIQEGWDKKDALLSKNSKSLYKEYSL